MRAGTKFIVQDEPTLRFLGAMRSVRRNAGLTLREVSRMLGIPYATLKTYEGGYNCPSLHTLMKLAELFGYDLSDSVNYKYYYRTIQPLAIKNSLRKYGLTYVEVSRLTGYDKGHIYESVNMLPKTTLGCLAAVLEVIRHEQEQERFRRKHCLTRERRQGRCVGLEKVSGKS